MPAAPEAQPTQRAELIRRLEATRSWDLAIVGGGATGLGVALDAVARGFSVVLVESHDFAKGTSSRATKLVHGGVRYLAQGNVALVREALRERTLLLHNAPHLAQPLPFVMPSYRFWETPFYGIGLKAYDALAGAAGLGATQFLSRKQTLACLPGARPDGLKGGVKYWDGQFDDARLALVLARTAAQRGALLLNYCAAVELLHKDGKVVGLVCRDQESGRRHRIEARCVINAAGVWVDELRQQDGQAIGRQVKPMVAPSQGLHVVVDREFLGGDHALMVPKTEDGRVLFGVPWLGKLILGTTDSPRQDIVREPEPFREEVRFILEESARYLTRAPSPADIRSIWVGLRPLVKPQDDDGDNTKSLSREHTVLASRTGLVTVTGGKWTTYRAMAEDVLQKCFTTGLLPDKPSGATIHLPLVGAPPDASSRHYRISEAQGLAASNMQYAESLVRNSEVIDAMGMAKDTVAHWAKRYLVETEAVDRTQFQSSKLLAWMKFVRNIVQVALLGVGALLILDQQLTGGAMIAGSILVARLLAPIEAAMSYWKQFVLARESLKRLSRFCDLPDARPSQMSLPKPSGAMSIEGLTFFAPGVKGAILKNVSFAIGAGNTLAIVGPSASGKTTLSRLLVGVLKPSSGHVRLDGADTFDWMRSDFGPNVGYLPQDVELLPGTIRGTFLTDEVSYVVEGRLTVVTEGAEPREVRAGDVMVMTAGLAVEWQIHEPMTKLWNVYRADGLPL